MLQLDSLVPVLQVQLALVAEIAVHDEDERLPEVGQLEEQTLLDLLEITIADLIHAGLRVEVVDEQFVLAAEVLGQVVVDEGHVRAVPADLEDLLAAQSGLAVPAGALDQVLAVVVLLAEATLVPALLDVAEQLDAQLVGVQPPAPPAQRPRVVVGVVNHLRVGEDLLRHQLRVPVGRPPLVHDLGLRLRRVVIGLLPDDRQDVPLPVLDRRMVDQELQHVALGGLGKALLAPGLLLKLLLVGLDELGRVDEIVHVRLALHPPHLGPRLFRLVAVLGAVAHDEGRVGIDEVLQGQADVHEVLDHLHAVGVHVAADARPVVGHHVHHLAVGLRERQVVLEEVAVSVDVRHHQLLVDDLVALQQVGVAGVVVDDHLVDLRQAVGVRLLKIFVLHPEAPVRVAGGETAEGGDLVEPPVIQELEDDRKEVKAVRARVPLDLLLEVLQVLRQVRHLSAPVPGSP